MVEHLEVTREAQVLIDIRSFLRSYLEVRGPFYSQPELITVKQFTMALEHHLTQMETEIKG